MITLDRLIIKNYKSIQDIELNLGNLNVFVGPNNVGKSNIFDCLNFLAQFILKGPEAVNIRGGFSTIVWNGEINRIITIQLEGKIDSKRYEYIIEIAGGPIHFYIRKELFSVDKALILEFPSKEDPQSGVVINEINKKVYPLMAGTGDRPFLIHAQSVAVGTFIQYVIRWDFYNFVPQDMEKPLEAIKTMRLASKGENISQVLLSLHSEYPDEYEKIRDILQSAIGEIKTIHTSLEGNKTFITIQEEDLGMKIPAWAMSDGTLRLLAHLCALYPPPPVTVVCFEEPENCIHPHLMEVLANIFKNAPEETQVLITTHSPYLLDLFEPKDVIIVEKKRGATQIKYAKNKKGIKDALVTLGLGELWYSGSLGGIPE